MLNRPLLYLELPRHYKVDYKIWLDWFKSIFICLPVEFTYFKDVQFFNKSFGITQFNITLYSNDFVVKHQI